ncbi:hypothetical protein AM493_11235 [Flavobacterium akiainvivens]|uniref:Outer membrane protein beta-barrel domain-containing protein n=1 Tax=Flavobacterium akiainvivens TaxID=1202724 RepID=A0A0M8M9S5_9FLAO|nr:hypothetical protein [Flavobacterium akiainvivens]KOS06543.1 hypothetical protein AM493_11235 [Flavobacterium akiainvivens]
MKTPITFLLLLFCNWTFGQIPSIKEDYEDTTSKKLTLGFDSGVKILSEDESDMSFANNISLLYTDKSTIVQTELISDYMGLVRLSFGSVINATSEESAEGENAQSERENNNEQELLRTLNGGGNFYLSGLLPFWTYKRSLFLFMPSLNGKISADIEGMGSNVAASDVRGMLYPSLYVSRASDNKKFNFFLQAEYGLLFATNDFYDQFEIDRNSKTPVLLGRAMFGVTIGGSLRFTVVTKSVSNYKQLINDKVMIGLQFLSKN